MKKILAILGLAVSSTLFAQPSDFNIRQNAETEKYLLFFDPVASWPNKTYKWYYNPENAPPELPSDVVVQVMQYAMQKWADQCNIKVVYKGLTTTRPETTYENYGPDRVNVLGWGPMWYGFSAYATIWPGENNDIIDGDIVVDPSKIASVERLEPLLMHEFGHAIGLAHSDVNDASMSGPPYSTYNSRNILSVDDVRGCRELYGPDEWVNDPVAPSLAIEYYHERFDHYFITADPNEIAALDSGYFTGWKRTKYKFKAHTVPQVNFEPICRFYLPPPEDSHFYSADPEECKRVQKEHPTFILESESVMFLALPDQITEYCPTNTIPVYRLWNNRPDTNHRYTTSIAVRDNMILRGYIPEGTGPNAITFCAPL